MDAAPVILPALAQQVHGALGVLCAAICAHPALTLRVDTSPGRRARLSAYLSALLLGLTVPLGWYLYGDYRATVRPWLVVHHPAMHHVGFELKEALGFFSLTTGLASAALVRWGAGLPTARRAARLGFRITALAVVTTAILGIAAASLKHL